MVDNDRKERLRQEIAEMHNAGLEVEAIANELELSVQTVRHYMRDLAITHQPEGLANAQKFEGDIIQAFLQGEAVAAIATKYDTSVYCVTKMLVEEGVYAEGRERTRRTKEEREQLVLNAYNQGMRVLEIAKTFRISQAHIYVVLSRHGITPQRRSRFDGSSGDGVV